MFATKHRGQEMTRSTNWNTIGGGRGLEVSLIKILIKRGE